MRILILGCLSLVGQELIKYFVKNTHYEISGTWSGEEQVDDLLNDKSIEAKFNLVYMPLDIENFSNHIINTLSERKYDYIINCINISDELNIDNYEYILINSLLPNYLSNLCENRNIKLIHITNNDVYLFRRNNGEYDEHNEVSIIGKTKSLGELSNCMVLRVSKFIKEYTLKTEWSGMTGKEFSSICHQIIDNDLWKPEKYNIYSTTNDGTPDQNMWTVKDLQSKLKIKSIEKQLAELAKD